VYGWKNGPQEPVPVAGQAFRLVALNLPFLVGRLGCDPAHPPVTFDVRYLDFMAITDDFVQAQAASVTFLVGKGLTCSSKLPSHSQPGSSRPSATQAVADSWPSIGSPAVTRLRLMTECRPLLVCRTTGYSWASSTGPT